MKTHIAIGSYILIAGIIVTLLLGLSTCEEKPVTLAYDHYVMTDQQYQIVSSLLGGKAEWNR